MSVMADDRLAVLDHVRMWIQYWHCTTGPEHADARRELQSAIAYWRKYHDGPANARYAAVVAASKAKRKAA